MIPKTIHYCWFGRGEKPKLAKKCIASWQKFCPDYEIIEWNEDNFDINCCPYTKWCYENQKWAFLSDYVRLWAIEQYGGIYLDTDVELVTELHSLAEYGAFFGFESTSVVATGLGFGAEAHHKTVAHLKKEYDNLSALPDGSFELTACPALNTKALMELGLCSNGKIQMLGDAIILPVDYLNPYDDATGKLQITENTISIHHYAKSWISKKLIIRSKLAQPFHRIFGKNCFEFLKTS